MRMLNVSIGIAARAAAVGVFVTALSLAAGAQVAGTDEAAGYIVFPKIVVDTSAVLGPETDTLVQITNTDLLNPHTVSCTWVNATSRCGVPAAGCPAGAFPGVPGVSGAPCDDNGQCNPGLSCVPCWSEIDFQVPAIESEVAIAHAESRGFFQLGLGTARK